MAKTIKFILYLACSIILGYDIYQETGIYTTIAYSGLLILLATVILYAVSLSDLILILCEIIGANNHETDTTHSSKPE